MPVTPFASVWTSVISSSCGAEALGMDGARVVAAVDQQVGHGLDEGRRAADEDQRARVGGGYDLGQHAGVDAPRVAAPARGRRAREGPGDVQSRPGLELF